MPDWHYEMQAIGPVCGVDEAGRGPLAGPVVAAAVILDPQNCPAGLNDSKQISGKNRARLFTEIFTCAQVGIGISEPEEIDRINILAASLIAMRRAVLALPTPPQTALIDGNKAPDLPMTMTAQTLVKGDAKSLSIAAASIIAKVTRDRIMSAAETRFPGYGLAQHKGYPTAAHRTAIETLGPCPVHRFSFKPVNLARR